MIETTICTPPDTDAVHPLLRMVGPCSSCVYSYAPVVVYIQQPVVGWSGMLPFTLRVPRVSMSRIKRLSGIGPMTQGEGSAFEGQTTSVSTVYRHTPAQVVHRPRLYTCTKRNPARKSSALLMTPQPLVRFRPYRALGATFSPSKPSCASFTLVLTGCVPLA